MPILGITASQQTLRTTPPILTNLATWIDPSDSGSVTLSSGKVSQINDLSGNGRHMVQATSTNQPTYASGVKNGLNAMQMSGSQWVRQSSNWTPASTTTFYIVYMMSAGYLATGWTNYRLDLTNRDNTYNTGAIQVEGGNITVQAATFDTANSTWYYTTLVRQTGNSAQTWLNTSAIASSASSSFSALGSGVLTLGTRGDNAAPMTGYIGEVLMYDGTHNSTQIGQTQSYLAAKWGI